MCRLSTVEAHGPLCANRTRKTLALVESERINKLFVCSKCQCLFRQAGRPITGYRIFSSDSFLFLFVRRLPLSTSRDVCSHRTNDSLAEHILLAAPPAVHHRVPMPSVLLLLHVSRLFIGKLRLAVGDGCGVPSTSFGGAHHIGRCVCCFCDSSRIHCPLMERVVPST